MSTDTEMAERHSRYLAEAAELSASLMRRLHERAMAAKTEEESDRASLAFHRILRSLRQTLALEERFERERRREAREAARQADETRRRQADDRRRHVNATVSRLIWTEAERDDISGLLVDLKRVLDREVFDEAFLEGAVDELVERVCTEIGLMAEDWGVDEDEEDVEAAPPDPSPPPTGEGDREAVEGALGAPERQSSA